MEQLNCTTQNRFFLQIRQSWPINGLLNEEFLIAVIFVGLRSSVPIAVKVAYSKLYLLKTIGNAG